MSREFDKHETLAGNLLIASPLLYNPDFRRTVIYLCAYGAEGALGLIINRIMETVRFTDLMQQLGISSTDTAKPIHVHFGGTVEPSRGFVLHSPDYIREDTQLINQTTALTATTDVLASIASGEGPSQAIFALGYAGWAPGQLDAEIQANGWLTAPADPEFLFDCEVDDRKWHKAMKRAGVKDMASYSLAVGRA